MLYKNYISIKTSLVLITFLIIALSAMRVIGFFGPGYWRWFLPLGFCIMAMLPWLVLTANGRHQIGLVKSQRITDYIWAALWGAMAALICFSIGYLLFGNASDNWYVNIGNSYKTAMDTTGMSFWTLSLIFTLPAILFSPIGEEIFYRGIVQKTLEQKLSVIQSTLIECILFALIHQVHHGIIKTAVGFDYLPFSGMLWFAQMLLVAWMFAWLRAKTGSIFVPIVAHMIFNITMNSTIFLFLW